MEFTRTDYFWQLKSLWGSWILLITDSKMFRWKRSICRVLILMTVSCICFYVMSVVSDAHRNRARGITDQRAAYGKRAVKAKITKFRISPVSHVVIKGITNQEKEDSRQSQCSVLPLMPRHNLKDPMLTLFTTMTDTREKQLINLITIRNWAQFGAAWVKPVLFLEPRALRGALSAEARKRGWDVLQITDTNEFGTPVFKEIFTRVRRKYKSTFHGYANGDVLFDDTLLRTLEAVSQLLGSMHSTLVVGERSNLNLQKHLKSKFGNVSIDFSFEDLTRKTKRSEAMWCANQVSFLASQKGEPFRYDALDYFLLSHHPFPWHQFPRLVVGRPGYDNYFHVFAKDHGTKSIDASKTLHALHLTGTDGNYAGAKGKDDARYNKKLIRKLEKKKFKYNRGQVLLCRKYTYFDENNTVVVAQRLYRNRQTIDTKVKVS